MKVVYVGTSGASPDSTVTLGYTFARNGEPVEVVSPAHLEKLKNNPSFEIFVSEAKAESKPKAPAKKVLKKPSFE